MANTIKCKNCGIDIEVSEALTHQIEEQVLTTLKSQHNLELEKVKKEAEMASREKIAAEMELTLKDKLNESEELKAKNKAMQEEMLAMSKAKRELKDQMDRQELETQKKLDVEREKIQAETLKMVSEKSQGEVAELKKQLEDTRKSLESANYKLQQTSQQMQGEILELDLEKSLREAFVHDEIEAIGKGVQGADIIHHVRGQSGKQAGIILWELKDAKWSPGWLTKLREDGRKVEASVVVLVCKHMPPDVETFQLIDGVLVTSVSHSLPLATLVRRSILQIAVAKQTASNKDEKLEFLYEYLQSEAFRHRFESFAEGVKGMQEDLEAERRSMEKSWKRREIQIRKTLVNASRMYGELQGVMGNALPEIKTLSLPNISDHIDGAE